MRDCRPCWRAGHRHRRGPPGGAPLRGGGVAQHELAALRDAGYSIVVSASGVHGITEAHTLSERIESISRVSAASPVLSQAVDLFTRTSGPTRYLPRG